MTPCESIVSVELWEKCNAILDEQSKKRAKKGRISEYLLAGLVKCECGTSMYVFSTAKNFTCKKCKNHVKVSDMDDVYQQVLKGYLNDIQPQIYVEELQTSIREKETLLTTAIKKRTQLRKKMDELVPLRISGDLDKEHFAEIYQPLVTQVHQLDESLPELQAEIDLRRIQLTSADHVLREAKSLYRAWSGMLFSQKRPIVETITEYIKVGKDTIDIGISHLSSSSGLTSQHEFTDSWMPRA